jgi:PST family polysaccharide transporter
MFFVQYDYKILCTVSLLIFIGNLFNPVFFLIGIEKFTIVSIFNAFARLLYLVSFIFILNDHKHNYLNNLLFGTSYCIISIIMFFYIKYKYQISLNINLKNKNFINDCFNAFPLIINNAYQNLDVYLHNFLVGFLAKNNDLGLFTAIEKFYSMFKQAIIALIEILYPRVCNSLNKKRAKQNLNNITIPLNFLFVAIYICVFTFKSEISYYLTRDSGEVQKNLLMIFMLIPFFIINLNFKSHLELMALKLDKYLSEITLFALLSKSLLCVLLFYLFGLYGIVITLIFTEVISGIAKSMKVNQALFINE